MAAPRRRPRTPFGLARAAQALDPRRPTSYEVGGKIDLARLDDIGDHPVAVRVSRSVPASTLRIHRADGTTDDVAIPSDDELEVVRQRGRAARAERRGQ